MAADTLLSAHNAQNRVQKLFRLPDGGVAGGCGNWLNAYSCLKWLADGGDPCGPDALRREKDHLPSVADATVLIARPDGSLWTLEDDFPATPLMDRVAAVGCGSDAALMAMALGKTAVEAVRLVVRQDLLCADPVQGMEVEQPHQFAAVVTHGRRRKAV